MGVVQAFFPERRIPAGTPIQRFARGGMPRHPSAVAGVQRRSESAPGRGMPLHPAVQRKSLGAMNRGTSTVQRREDVHAFKTPAGFLERSGPGDPLPAGVKQRMERYFGADFSDVRVHVGHEAKSIGALAFTLGSDIYFAPEHYRPGTRAGQELLGHELTHVVQQREGRVANPFGDGVAVVQDFELEAEADRHGKAAAQGRLGLSRAASPVAQRKPGHLRLTVRPRPPAKVAQPAQCGSCQYVKPGGTCFECGAVKPLVYGAPPVVVVPTGPVQGVNYTLGTASKDAVRVYYGGSEFTGSGKGCAEPKLLKAIQGGKKKGKSGKAEAGSFAWSQNTLPCDTCHALLQTCTTSYGDTYTVTVQNTTGKPYGSVHGLPNNAETTITYANGAATYRA